MANAREIQSRMKSIQDTRKITKCHVFDLLHQAEEEQKASGGYRALLL
ncbi:MAG: hypothetical protein ACLTBV_22120 [Enterocloster bolteae]